MSLARSASLKQVATFRAVARLGSVSLAAEEMHLSQSAVSIQVASLEAAAGAQLLERTGRGVRLTEAGELLLSYADRLVSLWNETSDEMDTYLGAFAGTLRIGAVSTAEYWVPRFLVDFVNQNSRVKINLVVANRQDIVRSLASHEIDVAVMGRPPEELATRSSCIGTNPMAFVSAPHCPTAGVKVLSLAQLSERRLLVRERGSGTRTSLERVFKEAGLRFRVGSELSSNEAIKQMCAAGFGPAYLSLHTCLLELQAGLLKILPLPNNPTERGWHVVSVETRQLPKVALAFEQFMRREQQAKALRAAWQHLVPRAKVSPRPTRAPA